MIKIAIIKLGAQGDVIRTLALLPAIKKAHPDSEIVWITKNNVSELLENHPHINRVLSIPTKSSESFDILYNFDTDEAAAKMASEITATKKYGFYSQEGFPAAFNSGAEYYLNTMFDDELKKKNKKTYQEMMFEAAELPYEKILPKIYLSGEDIAYAENYAQMHNFNYEKLIGIHLGASSRWPSKKWHKENLKDFIKKAKKDGYKIILFAGPDEEAEQESICNELAKENISIFKNNPNNTKRQFASLINLCSQIVCSDSFALHIATTLRKKGVALFFCTSANEVEDYGLFKKIISTMLYDFFPERMDEFSEELTKSISAEEVLNAIKQNEESEKNSAKAE